MPFIGVTVLGILAGLLFFFLWVAFLEEMVFKGPRKIRKFEFLDFEDSKH
jgi:hypothetical protein